MAAQPSHPTHDSGMPPPGAAHHYPPPSSPPPPPPPAYSHPTPTPTPPQPATTQKPSTYLALSIIAILFSLIFGAIGIYFSTQVTSRWNAGDAAGSKKASNTALTLDIIGIAVGVLFGLLVAGGG